MFKKLRAKGNKDKSRHLMQVGDFDFSGKPYTKSLCLRASHYHKENIDFLKDSLGRVRPIAQPKKLNEFVASCVILLVHRITDEAANNIRMHSATFLPTKSIPKSAPYIISFSLFLLSGMNEPIEAENINLNVRELTIDTANLYFSYYPDMERAQNALNGIETHQNIIKEADDEIKEWHSNLIKLLDTYIIQWNTDNKDMKEFDCMLLFSGLLVQLLKKYGINSV